MSWMKRLCIQLIIVGLVCCGTNIALAEDASKLEFPTTEEEIIEALNVELPDVLTKPRGGLRSQGNDNSLFGEKSEGTTRGLAGIANDEEALKQAPKVGALILFDYNSAEIKEESKPLLQMYGKVLQGELADTVLVVAGHTDSKGSDQYNVALSRRRAEAVKQFLVAEYQIAENRLLVKPYGEKKPLESNATNEGRAKNRRVEFIRIQ